MSNQLIDQYLHYTLSHPDPTKRLIVYGQVVRDNRGYVSRKMIFECICSKWNHFETNKLSNLTEA